MIFEMENELLFALKSPFVKISIIEAGWLNGKKTS